MSLDPQVVAYRAARAAAGIPPLYTQTLAEARAADLAAIRAGGGDVEPVHEVRDTTVPGPAGDLRVRVHRPAGDGPLPTLVYFFGGGWTLGSVETADGICRRLANATPCQVVTVGYRLAPEHPFPAAVLDCHAATRWLAEHAVDLGVDPDRLVVGGDSAGGNLAAAVTLLARAEGGPRLAGQLLVYPNTDQRADRPRPGRDAYPATDAAARQPTPRLVPTPAGSPTSRTRCCSTGTPSTGTAVTTWPIRRTRPIRWRRRCWPTTWPACRRPWWSPPSTTRCATRGSGTPSGCARPGCRCGPAAIPA